MRGKQVFYAAAVFLVAASGCGRNPSFSGPVPPGTLHDLNNGNAGQTVAVAWGDTVDITLQTIGPGEYGTPELSSPAIHFEKMLPARVILPAGPTQIYQFVARAPGMAVISIPHSYRSAVFIVSIEVN